ncbi:MAG: hypothetical protein ACM3SQ_13045 [Betaproteobacteria bacterium]
MATFTYDELKHKTIAELRDIAKGVDHEAVKGYTQLNKEHLLPALCQALGIDASGHHAARGIDKAVVKAKMRALHKERDAALASGDGVRLKALRRHIHKLNHQIRVHAR